ncbi:MAG TPA: hypothetical protein VFE22_12595 [Edaphobacter sp.]|jgi:hypothetical protein|nr:hypothetical protein [Edaphobacter sp.]
MSLSAHFPHFRHLIKGTALVVPQAPSPSLVILNDGAKCRAESLYFAFTIAAVIVCLGFSPRNGIAQTKQIQIRILNAKNGHPIKHRTLAIVLGTQQNIPDGPTNAEGTIVVAADPSTTISLVTQPYAECRPKAPSPWAIKYSVADIIATGITTPNVCGKSRATARPGEIIIFERPRGLLEFLAAPIAY